MLAVAVAACLAVGLGASAPGVYPGSAVPAAARASGLTPFESCPAALAELRRAARPLVGPYGLPGQRLGLDFGDAVAAPGVLRETARLDTPGYSATTVHERSVDEADVVKTDGRRLVTVADGTLRVIDVASRSQQASLSLPGARHGGRLLLHADRALVLTTGPFARASGLMDEGWPPVHRDHLTLVDLAGGARVLGTLAVDAQIVDARQVGSVARVVVRSSPRLDFVTPSRGRSAAQALRYNRAVLDRSTIDDWVPAFSLSGLDGRRTGRLVDCAAIARPAEYSSPAMLTVLTVDLAGPLGTGDPVAVIAEGGVVYGTEQNLYVAHNRHVWSPPRHGDRAGPRTARTEIFQFAHRGADKPEFVASGAVGGVLLNQYALSEHRGHLRVATTTFSGARSRSGVAVLTRRGDALVRVGQVSGLGVGERIFGVRFLGDTAYVVTFRRIDPLYRVDLADPSAPRVTGEVKIPGYSAYLHPVGAGRLLGVGQERLRGARMSATQVSLFDVGDPASPRRIDRHHEPGTAAAVEHDQHAFLFWRPHGLVVLPMQRFGWHPGSVRVGSGALVLRLSGDALREVGFVAHPGRGHRQAVLRPVMIGGELWTVGRSGAMVSDPESLSRLGWIRFG